VSSDGASGPGHPARAEKARQAAGRLADTLGSMLAFVGGALGGFLGAGFLELEGWRAASFTVGIAAATVVGLRQLPGGPTAGDDAAVPAGTHLYRLRSRRLVHGALAVGLATSGWGLRALGLGHFAPALVAGPLVLVACLVLLASRTHHRLIRTTAEGLVISEGRPGDERALPFADIRRALCDDKGALLIDAGDRRKNLLLPSAVSGWSTFYVTGLEALAGALEQALGERFQKVDGVMPALRRLARGEDPLPPAPAPETDP
jgi:hypothetical protein